MIVCLIVDNIDTWEGAKKHEIKQYKIFAIVANLSESKEGQL